MVDKARLSAQIQAEHADHEEATPARTDLDPQLLKPRIAAPFRGDAAGCGAFVIGATTQPRHCHAAPTWAGLLYFDGPPHELHWTFSCDEHAGHLHAARRLLDRDIAELAWRREQRDLALAGRAHQRPEPLATGLEARRRLARAVAMQLNL